MASKNASSSRSSRSTRMSTGGRAPPRRNPFIDDEAQEASASDEEQHVRFQDDVEHHSFVEDDGEEEDQGTPTPPAPSPKKSLKRNTPALTTRSQAAKNRQAEETIPLPRTPHAKTLNTRGHSLSLERMKNGVPSAAVVKPDGDRKTQTKLVASSSPLPAGVSAAQYQAILAFQASQKEDPGVLDVDGEKSESPPPAPAGRRTPKVRRIPDHKDAEADGDNNALTSPPPASKRAMKAREQPLNKSVPLKRRGSTSGSVHASIPDAINAAFKKSRTLDDRKIYTVNELPDVCGVTDKRLQDSLLYDVYETLAPVQSGKFATQSSQTGDGNMEFSRWPEYCDFEPEHRLASLWNAINFVDHRRFINLARISPLGLQAIGQRHSGSNRAILGRDGQSCVVLSTVRVVRSSVLEATSITDGPSSSVSKYITAVFHAQDCERVAGVCCMVFNAPAVFAHVFRDAFTFGTKSRSTTSAASGSGRSGGIPSSATMVSASASSSRSIYHEDALNWDNEIPVYDARELALDLSQCLDALDEHLPRFNQEIPPNSCVVIGHTVSRWPKPDANNPAVSLNLRFAIVIATPE